MKVILLSPKPELVEYIFKGHILTSQSHNGPIPQCDWVISFGHRHILKPEVIAPFNGRILNVHWAYLPWNRGADPNFWAWHDETPHGVTVHHIDEGVDTGPIVLRIKVKFRNPEKHTLETSYAELQRYAVYALEVVWGKIVDGEPIPAIPQEAGGSLHKMKDRPPLALPAGWSTPVEYVRDYGRRERGKAV